MAKQENLEEATINALQGKMVENNEDNKWEQYLNKTIAIYDINDFIKKECGEQYEAFDYRKGAAIFTEGEGSGRCCIVDREAVGQRFDNTNEEFKLGLVNIPEKSGTPIMAQYSIKTSIAEILEKGKATPSTFKNFFNCKDNNLRCQENFNELINYLEAINVLNKEEDKEPKEEFLDPNITIAPSTSLDLGDGAGLGMLAGLL